jgi:hypothetical protein
MILDLPRPMKANRNTWFSCFAWVVSAFLRLQRWRLYSFLYISRSTTDALNIDADEILPVGVIEIT